MRTWNVWNWIRHASVCKVALNCSEFAARGLYANKSQWNSTLLESIYLRIKLFIQKFEHKWPGASTNQQMMIHPLLPFTTSSQPKSCHPTTSPWPCIKTFFGLVLWHNLSLQVFYARCALEEQSQDQRWWQKCLRQQDLPSIVERQIQKKIGEKNTREKTSTRSEGRWRRKRR